MSAANAAAKKRRANMGNNAFTTSTNPVPAPLGATNSTSPTDKSRSAMTLPQVIALVDTRLTKLEENASKSSAMSIPTDVVRDEELKPILQEYDHRFSMLATQINDLKDMLMKLQTYTMDVNKTLLEERIQFVSETTIENTLEEGSDALQLGDLKFEETEIVSSEQEQDQVPTDS
jgi:hypothetical protein